ncbi:MAG: hypothetical protein SFV32_14525 [Opitutaceae bacterium]|nr:hypothetical protein [Opitutaceae bacterium]
MLGLLFLFLCWLTGRWLWEAGLGRAAQDAIAGTKVPEWVVREPVSWVAGMVTLGWTTYLVGYLCREAAHPLAIGNTASFALGFAVLYKSFRKFRRAPGALNLQPLRSPNLVPVLIAAIGGSIFGYLCFRTFFLDGSQLGAGVSVFSDFGPHVAVIRSFSVGHNFPTEYPHFPAGDARYHFLFQFFAGNLELLGLPLDWAFNLPSLIVFVSALLLLYALATVLTGRAVAGGLTVFLFCFRPGVAGYHFAFESGSFSEFVRRFLSNTQFIAVTKHEDWGLWNQNVYLNQRHLSLGLTVLLFALLSAFPLLVRSSCAAGAPPSSLPSRIKDAWLTRSAWFPRPVAQGGLCLLPVGLLLGASGFWNGATVIGALLMLGVMTLFARHRLELAGLATVAVVLAWLQNRLFLGAGALAVKPEWVFGFLADEPRSLYSVFTYAWRLLGLTPVLVLAGVVVWFWRCREPREDNLRRAWLAAALAPLVFAFVVKLTPDIAINHKYVMISVAALNVFVAWLLVRIADSGTIGKVVASACVPLVCLTGLVDFVTVLNKSRREHAILADLAHPAHVWIVANTSPKDRLLTDWYSYHTLLFTGRKIFYGWPYYAWSAGYDTGARERLVKAVYGGRDWRVTREILKSNHIAYVVIDDGNRRSDLYHLQEDFLRSHLAVVFEQGDTVILKVPNDS